jgi:hypothetical protein
LHDYRTNTSGVPARYVIELLNFMPGVYILENIPPPGGKYQPMSFGGKNMKRGREKGKKKKEERGRKREKGK